MAQLFADISTPYVNEMTLKRVLSSKLKENIFQDILVKPEEGATEKYTEDTSAAEVQVIRILPNDRQAREIGADYNGGNFNNEDPTQPKSAAYGVKIITTIDHVIDLPTVQQDMVNVDLAEAEGQNLKGKVAQNVNALSIAAMMKAKLNALNTAGYAGTDSDAVRVIKLGSSPAAGDYVNAILDAGAHLDNGNIELGIDTYPKENRAIYMRSTFKSSLLKKGEILIGGSNYAQDILQKGGLDRSTIPNTVTGYIGEIDSTPCYVVSNPIWRLVERYIGVTKGSLDKVLAVVTSSIGTLRGLAFNNSLKTVPSPAGQGIRLQPLYRMGAECLDDKAVVLIVADGFVVSDRQVTLLAPSSKRFTITYDGNGNTTGSVPTDTTKYTYEQAATTNAGTGLVKSAKAIESWNTKANATGDTYALNSAITGGITGDLKLYAKYAA
jgi:hypothetical protein